MRVKICGITSIDDALAACDAGADALGFVFAPEAKVRGRYIDPGAARDITKRLPPFVATVGVCVGESLAVLQQYLEFVDYVQLCGDESPELCAALGHRAIKVFGAELEFEPADMLAFPAGAYLLDARTAGQHGGTGQTCDWAVAQRAVALGRPVILAGGLTPENVAEAVRAVRPYGVDTSGGVEYAPGKKDHERIRQFVRNAKAPVA